MSDAWYVAKEGKEFGPFPLAELQKRLGELDLTQLLVWRAGFPDWKPAREVPEFQLKPPPLPPHLIEVASKPVVASSVSEKGGTRKVIDKVIGIGAFVIGVALAKAVGVNFWLPTILITAAWFILKKLKVGESVLPMLAILIGHTAWITVGVVILASLRGVNADFWWATFDPVVVAGLAFWVIRRGSASSCIAVLVYEAGGMIYVLFQLNEGTNKQIALTVHLLLRVAGIVAAAYAVWCLRKPEIRGAVRSLPP